MNDYISRHAAIIEMMDNDVDHAQGTDGREVVQILSDIPAADVVPVVHGRWLPQKENHEFKEAWMKCSVCGYPVSRWTGNTNFCPSCGAKMDEHEEE